MWCTRSKSTVTFSTSVNVIHVEINVERTITIDVEEPTKIDVETPKEIDVEIVMQINVERTIKIDVDTTNYLTPIIGRTRACIWYNKSCSVFQKTTELQAGQNSLTTVLGTTCVSPPFRAGSLTELELPAWLLPPLCEV